MPGVFREHEGGQCDLLEGGREGGEEEEVRAERWGAGRGGLFGLGGNLNFGRAGGGGGGGDIEGS